MPKRGDTMTPVALKRMMERNRWSIDDLAELTVRDRRTVNRWRSGESPMPILVVRHLRRKDRDSA